MLRTDNFRDKDSKKPEYRELYETLPFIDAYAKHTDMRIAKDGPELAIGAKPDGFQNWDVHGKAQLDFLISRGLQPEHRLLDFGCGTGRLADQAIPYLNPGMYVGIDISSAAIDICIERADQSRYPVFWYGDGTLNQVRPRAFNMIWSHSVVTHLPPDIVETLFKQLSTMSFGEWCFTYKQAEQNQRSGLKQFQYFPGWFVKTAKLYGLKAEPLPHEWAAGQKTMCISRG